MNKFIYCFLLFSRCIHIFIFILLFISSFTMYDLHSTLLWQREPRNLVLRYSVPIKRLSAVFLQNSHWPQPFTSLLIMKVLNISFPGMEIESTICRAYSRTLVPYTKTVSVSIIWINFFCVTLFAWHCSQSERDNSSTVINPHVWWWLWTRPKLIFSKFNLSLPFDFPDFPG